MARIDLPDAPAIRFAETYGAPYYGCIEPDDDEPIFCPVCGCKDPEEFITDSDGIEVIGCDVCTKRQDTWEWYRNHRK